ncbi:MAG: [FeFe] hydrogenase H-cluster maturation GTPase HydF, partial [Anaerotignum sp.]|nr:[FeFe] hydrogenase H-cluster maturation GTPase HydF [Anaerotignum sp.]
ILPQVQTIRDILDGYAFCMVVQPQQLTAALNNLKTPPKMVVTDSQVFGTVSKIVPDDVELTSFSILMARYKGDLEINVKGARALEHLKDGDKVLISEGCTHHRQCEDIGTVKLPRWIQEYTGKKLEFQFTSGTEFPIDLSEYALIVHCGGCTLNEREMKSRLKCAEDQNIPMTNYGICIAYLNGILERSIRPLGI